MRPRRVPGHAHAGGAALEARPGLRASLAAYNAGAGAVAACMCVPPYPETQAYVAKILGLVGGAGDVPPALEVRLVE